MDWSHAFDPRRWRTRFRSEQAVADEAVREGRTPDASVDEVGAAKGGVGFDGKPLHDDATGNGYGTGKVGGSGWAGWGA